MEKIKHVGLILKVLYHLIVYVDYSVRCPVDFVKLGHFMIDDIERISDLAWPPANFGPKQNPTYPSHPSTTFPHLLTIFGSIAQGGR